MWVPFGMVGHCAEVGPVHTGVVVVVVSGVGSLGFYFGLVISTEKY